MEVACGQCLGCRIDRRRMWAMRIVHESQLHDVNSFVTLTYREKYECDEYQLSHGYHVPDDWSLHKSHFQKFMKRLRHSRTGQKIRYFMCGEYGSTCQHGIELKAGPCQVCRRGRPHYHAILFNCGFPDLEEIGDGLYTSRFLEEIWKYGYIGIGSVSFESAAYVAGYCLKKITGQQAEEEYKQVNVDGEECWIEPEYAAMSRRPGIGKEWFDKYVGDCFPSDEVPVVGSNRVIKKVPRYYEEKFAELDEKTHREVKEARKRFRAENADEYSPARLLSKYKCLKAGEKLREGRF